MKRNRSLLSIITCFAFGALLAGCNIPFNNVDQGAYIVLSDESDWEFYVIKGKDKLYDVSDRVEAHGDIPGLEYGQGALVVADIDTEGYSTGGWEAVFFNDYESMVPMGIDEIAEKLNIPEVEDPAGFFGEFFSKYTDGNDIYYILSDWHNYEVMKNGNPYLCCELFDRYSPGPLLKAVSLGYDGPESMMDIDLTEDEILNMPEEDLWFYGIFKDHLKDKTLSVAGLSEDATIEEGRYAAAYPEDQCIGEYLVEVEDGSVLRRYYMGNNIVRDYPRTEVTLSMDEWHISEDGTVKFKGCKKNVREAIVPYILIQ